MNTIAEECILLLRTLYNKQCIKQNNVSDLQFYFDSLIVLNLIAATDYLANPSLEKNVFVSKNIKSIFNKSIFYFIFQKLHGLSYSAMASLMVIGGFDNRPRIGGNVLIKGKMEGLLSIQICI